MNRAGTRRGGEIARGEIGVKVFYNLPERSSYFPLSGVGRARESIRLWVTLEERVT